ncbi:hypothetical protein CC86DRAFT_411135 [Ophiobolus disseminans]|uniref:Uncharacterized protein n=1 Tax=Ophiobolus disseminans TaxID=1469910 RepID=A0A6A6ZM80_9PLEO|nr:hypothetical protein CC86DRAFT_411135 [Ophiobolus disseminans]
MGGEYFRHLELLNRNPSNRTESRNKLLTPPPTFLAGLPLAQQAEGYRVEDFDKNKVRKTNRHSLCVHSTIPGRDWVVLHNTVKVGVYLYGSGKIGQHYWEMQEVIDKWTLGHKENYVEMCEPQSGEERAMLRNLPYEMKDWRDKRGDEVITSG